MNLIIACKQILSQLSELVRQISDDDFSKPSPALSNSTVGQHLRHTLEFFICFQTGFEKGVINYDKRSHDKLIETDKFIALNALNSISEFVEQLDLSKNLKLEVGYDLSSDNFVSIDTNSVRELVYNIEHAVHHMAIMKIGVREIAPYLQLPSNFGVAASTVRFRNNEVPQSQA